MHGNETHVGINVGENGLLPLPDLFHKIQTANELTKNNIFVSMAVCKGLNFARSLHIQEVSILWSLCRFAEYLHLSNHYTSILL